MNSTPPCSLNTTDMIFGLDSVPLAVGGAVSVAGISLDSSRLVPGVVSGVFGIIPVSSRLVLDDATLKCVNIT